MPRRKNLWLFGSWFGEKYTDNTKYFYEYVVKNKKEIRAVWLTNNSEIIKDLRTKNYECYYAYSIRGYWLSMLAYYSFCTVSYADLNLYVHGKRVVNMWHGSPLKKIGYDDKHAYPSSIAIQEMSKIFFPFIKPLESYHYLLASSVEEVNNLASAFGKCRKEILLTGLPRNINLNKKKIIKNNVERFKVLYLPTHRNAGANNLVEFNLIENNKIINDFLESFQNIQLDIKMHFYHEKSDNLYTSPDNLRFIEDLKYDLYQNLNDYDLLITDYSSVYFDFLLCQKPIIFYPFDFEEYIINDRDFYYEYSEVTAGVKCFTWLEVIENIKIIYNGIDNYSSLRNAAKLRFHKYDSSEIMDQIFNQITS